VVYGVVDKGRFPLAVIALFIFIGSSCAKQGLPPGGLEDKVPPKLIGSIPGDRTVGVPEREQIMLEFSKPMDTRSVEDNFFMVPIPSFWPEFSWHSGNRRMLVLLKESLRDNTTYIISIGAKACDQRKNPLEDTITLTFSTGQAIENGKITGRIIPFSYFTQEPEQISGVDVTAYRIDDIRLEPDPRHDVPDYYTQTGANGNYEITGLSRGRYRIFAIEDRDGNGFYSEGTEMIGIAPHDVLLAQSDSVTAPMITISAKDTMGVQLRSLRAPDSRRAELFFDRAVVPGGIRVEFDGIDTFGWFVDFKSPQMVSGATAVQESGKRYALKTLKVFDRDGNGMAPLGFKPEFTGTDRPDTSALEIVEWEPKILTPDVSSVRLVFNRVLALSGSPDTSFAFADESGEDLAIKRTAPNELEITAPGGWREGCNYVISLDVEALRGVAGNRLSDAQKVLAFRAVPSDTLGFMAGTVVDSTGAGISMYRIVCKHLETETVKEIEVKGTSEWLSGGMLPGRYTACAFRDDDGDGRLFRGTVSPFQASEQAIVYPDTIRVVSRWKTEDIQFIFR
jgi:uncharacterized protein (DUF2141 family)